MVPFRLCLWSGYLVLYGGYGVMMSLASDELCKTLTANQLKPERDEPPPRSLDCGSGWTADAVRGPSSVTVCVSILRLGASFERTLVAANS